MSTSYWLITGVGLNADHIEISQKKLRAFLQEELDGGREDFPEVWEDSKELDVNDYLYGEPYDNLGDLLTFCDDTDTLTYGDDGEGTPYFYYPPSMPWQQGVRDPLTLDDCKRNIVKAVQRISDMTEEEIMNIIDEDLYVIGYG